MAYQLFLGYLMPKPFSEKNSSGTILPIAGRIRGFIPFPRVFSRKQRVRVRVTMLRVLNEFRRDSIGRGQHSSNRVSSIFTRTMHQSTTPSLSQTIWPRWASRQFLTLPIVQTLFPVTFGYSLSSEAVVMRQLRRWKRLWRRSLTRSYKRTSMGPSRSFWNGTTRALQPEEITSKGTRVSCVYYQ